MVYRCIRFLPPMKVFYRMCYLQSRDNYLPETPDDRLPVTDLRIYSYAFKKVIHVHAPLVPPAQVWTECLAFQRSVLPTPVRRQPPRATTRPRHLVLPQVAEKQRQKHS